MEGQSSLALRIERGDEVLSMDIRGREAIGARLREVRIASGFNTPEDMERAGEEKGINVSRQHVYKMEAGKVNFEIKKLEEVLAICDTTLFDFLLLFGAFRTFPKKDQNVHQDLQTVMDAGGIEAESARTTVTALKNQLRFSRSKRPSNSKKAR